MVVKIYSDQMFSYLGITKYNYSFVWPPAEPKKRVISTLTNININILVIQGFGSEAQLVNQALQNDRWFQTGYMLHL